MNFENLSFHAGLQWVPSEQFNLKLNYAKVGRSPNIAELFADGLHHSASVLELGNMGLKNEDGNQFNLNIDSKLNVLDGLQIKLISIFISNQKFHQPNSDGSSEHDSRRFSGMELCADRCANVWN